MKKKIVLFAATLLLASTTLISYAAEWGQDDTGYWYIFDSGAYARDQVVSIDGENYGFNQQAYMVKGWSYFNQNWYYFSPESGAQMYGWQTIDGNWYYLNPGNQGGMQTSWLTLGAKKYYFGDDGIMRIGSFSVNGYRYFAETDGSIRRNTTIKEGDKEIRYDENGQQWYRNEESKVQGSEWLPVLESDDLARQREQVRMENEDLITDKKDELYEEFKERVATAPSSARRSSRIETWKAKVNRQLSGMSVSQTEIDSYIALVLAATYGDDNGSWSYQYEEETSNGGTRTRTYTYRGYY